MIINRQKVYRLCKELQLLKPQRRIKAKHPRRLAKKREVKAPNQLWEMDQKYGCITEENRFFFIMSILDVYDRSIIDYHVGLSCTGSDAAYILTRAFNKRLPGQVLVRTDNGPQFISIAFEKACASLPVEHERIPNSTPNSIAHIESFHSILEDDCLRMHEFASYAEVYQVVSGYMNYYNEVRLHSAIGYRAPLEYHYEIINNAEETLPMSA